MTGGMQPAGRPTLPRTWRPRRARAATLPSAVLVFVGACSLAALLPAGWSAADRAGVLMIGTAVTAVLLVLARPVLRADEGGLTVVNLVTRRRLEWTEVVGVGLGRDDSWAMLDLADGTTIAVMALQTADGAATRRGVAELSALVAAYGEAPGDGRAR